MNSRIEEENKIDWSNPNNPATKKAIQELLNALSESVHFEVALYKNLHLLHIQQLKEKEESTQKMLSETEISMRTFWREIQIIQEKNTKGTLPDENFKSELQQVKDKIETQMVQLVIDNKQLKETLAQSTQEYKEICERINANRETREKIITAELTDLLKNGNIEVKDLNEQVISTNVLLEKIEATKPKSPQELLEKKDANKAITNLVEEVEEEHQAGVFTAMIHKGQTLSNINLARELLGKDFQGSNLQLFAMLRKIDKLTQAMEKINSKFVSSESSEMKGIYDSLKKLDALHNKIQKNDEDIKLANELLDSVNNQIQQLEVKNENKTSHSVKPKQ